MGSSPVGAAIFGDPAAAPVAASNVMHATDTRFIDAAPVSVTLNLGADGLLSSLIPKALSAPAPVRHDRRGRNRSCAVTLPTYYDRDCDLDLIRGRKVAVVGYGSQGRTQALNLRDSGVRDIRIGVREGKSAEAARADGFQVVPVAEAAGWAEVLALLTSDEAHRDLYRDEIAPHLADGACLVFAHGLSVRFGLVAPAPGLDVVLVSPKGIGPRIRDLYVEGEGVFCLFGVHQDASGRAHALGLSFAAALGCGR
jgi:hypothetical protein